MSSRGHRSVSLPDRDNVGLSPHWHGLSVMLWALNGLVYIVPLFAAGRWEHLIPTSWDIFPEAAGTCKVDISRSAPGIERFTPYDALQQLAYSVIIFSVSPFMKATRLAMPPAIRVCFPWFVKILDVHQGVRSLRFIGLVLMSAFILVHVVLVFFVHRPFSPASFTQDAHNLRGNHRGSPSRQRRWMGGAS